MQRRGIVCGPKAILCSPIPRKIIKHKKRNKMQKDYAAAKSWRHRINDVPPRLLGGRTDGTPNTS